MKEISPIHIEQEVANPSRRKLIRSAAIVTASALASRIPTLGAEAGENRPSVDYRTSFERIDPKTGMAFGWKAGVLFNEGHRGIYSIGQRVEDAQWSDHEVFEGQGSQDTQYPQQTEYPYFHDFDWRGQLLKLESFSIDSQKTYKVEFWNKNKLYKPNVKVLPRVRFGVYMENGAFDPNLSLTSAPNGENDVWKKVEYTVGPEGKHRWQKGAATAQLHLPFLIMSKKRHSGLVADVMIDDLSFKEIK